MNAKEFVTNFDTNNPDWAELPEGFPNCDLNGLTSEEIGKFNAIKALWQLAQPERQTQGSRTWCDPEGYRYLARPVREILCTTPT